MSLEEFLSVKEVQEILNLQKTRVYSLKSDPRISEFLGHEIHWRKRGKIEYLKEDIEQLKRYFSKSQGKRIMAFPMFKGGVGKTVSVGAISTILAEQFYKVLVIDLDYSQLNLTMDFSRKPNGEEIDFEGATIFELFEMTKDIDEIIHETRVPNLSIIPGSVRLAEIVLSTNRRTFLRQKLEKLNFDFIFIDTPPTIMEVGYWALIAATDVLIPCNPDRYSIQGIGGVLKSINIAREYNPRLNLLGIFATKVMEGTKAADIIREVASAQKLPFIEIEVPYRQDVINAVNEFKVITEYKPSSEVVKAYRQIIEEVIHV